VYASKTTHRESDRRGPRTEEPEPARVEGTTGRAGSGDQRRRRLRAVKLHPVISADAEDPRTGIVLGRLPFDDGSMTGGSMPTAIDLLGVTPAVHLTRQRDEKGVDPPFSGPLPGTQRSYYVGFTDPMPDIFDPRSKLLYPKNPTPSPRNAVQ